MRITLTENYRRARSRSGPICAFVRADFGVKSIQSVATELATERAQRIILAMRKFRIKGNGTLNSRGGPVMHSRDAGAHVTRRQDHGEERAAAVAGAEEGRQFSLPYYACEGGAIAKISGFFCRN